MKLTFSKYNNKCFDGFKIRTYMDYYDGFWQSGFYGLVQLECPNYLFVIGLKR